ncbi:hypothetical protein KY310_00225 [Candidatus Woesearchaeota archaeon]|nr:hypothetical protein [Candidatus Woesearchaeota archaeon]
MGILAYTEETKSDFEGTIIDLETVGEFDRSFSDSREYRGITPVILGLITRDYLLIFAEKPPLEIPDWLKGKIEERKPFEAIKKEIKFELRRFERPFYAFNARFEKGVLYHFIGEEIEFLELNERQFENKERLVKAMGIDTYDDPFQGNGLACSQAYQAGDVIAAMMHNRACLLKERDILLRRGHREADPLECRL